ncbi:MAG: hypothetical protein V4504_02040 [Patescibacteria group bacterium]
MNSFTLFSAKKIPLYAIAPVSLNLEYIFNKILELFQTIFDYLSHIEFGSAFYSILSLLSIYFIIIICYAIVRILEIRKAEHEHLRHEIAEYKHKHVEDVKEKIKNIRWQNVLKYLDSESQSDWKLAIIEADSILEDLTDTLEFQGDNLGERLKSVGKDRFKTLDDAWEAHLVRNRIAHEGLKFEITKREAQRVIYLYEKVFREFGHI